MSTNPPVELRAPLDALKKNASREQKEAIASHLFDKTTRVDMMSRLGNCSIGYARLNLRRREGGLGPATR